MGRVNRVEVGDMIYHVFNRANFRSKLFSKNFNGFLKEPLVRKIQETLGRKTIKKLKEIIPELQNQYFKIQKTFNISPRIKRSMLF